MHDAVSGIILDKWTYCLTGTPATNRGEQWNYELISEKCWISQL